ncbi:hypothetical protein MJG53_009117 [Ovis ammon polii x Ovis aries]|uniref:Uncharacterized protein n=1 Tax=Ovis ammon polii x Ovis aries TaxID=2918886 RepID=A0ACB9UYL8_9CETA|nr:hypothetical protein MJG53_009117 [Ovis ammon polii x Ovis aries]
MWKEGREEAQMLDCVIGAFCSELTFKLTPTCIRAVSFKFRLNGIIIHGKGAEDFPPLPRGKAGSTGTDHKALLQTWLQSPPTSCFYTSSQNLSSKMSILKHHVITNKPQNTRNRSPMSPFLLLLGFNSNLPSVHPTENRTGLELKAARKLSLLGSTGRTLNMHQTAARVQVSLQQVAWPSLSGSHQRAQRLAAERSN